MTSVLDTFLQNDVTNRGNFVDWLFLVETLVIMIATLFCKLPFASSPMSSRVLFLSLLLEFSLARL